MSSFTLSLISTSIIRAMKLFLYTKRELLVSRCFNDLQTTRAIGHMDPATEQSEQISLSKSVWANFCKALQAIIWTCSQRLCGIATRLKAWSRRNRLPMRSRRGIDRSKLVWIMCVSIRAWSSIQLNRFLISCFLSQEQQWAVSVRVNYRWR